ncbi:hypothetical protein GGG16DRAFT_66467, partial [Schizophyllum commune]
VELPSDGPYISHEVSYAIAVDCPEKPSRILPKRGVAAMIVSMPIDLRGYRQLEQESATSEISMTDTADVDGKVSSPISTQSGTNAQQGLAGSLANAQLLLPNCPIDAVPVALICVAAQDEIYSVMTSSLLQRHVLGISAPLVGLTFMPDSWNIGFVLGWITEGSGENSCDIHLAHGQLEHTIDHGLGIFDLSCASSSYGFAQALRRICVQLMPEMEHAQARASRTLETLSESRNKAWRSDLYVNVGGSDSFTPPSQRYYRGVEATEIPRVCFPAHARSRAYYTVDDLIFRAAPWLRISHLHPQTMLVKQMRSQAQSRAQGLAQDDTDSSLEVLAENLVQSYAWPPHHAPDELPCGEELSRIQENLILCVDFSSGGAASPAVMSETTHQVWDAFVTEIARERQLRAEHQLLPLRPPEYAHSNLIELLPFISQVSRNAFVVGNTAGARMPWERLLAASLHGETHRDVRIRHGRKVPYPRNAYFDRAHKTSITMEQRMQLKKTCQNFSNGVITLDWTYPDGADDILEPRWLHDAKARLSTVMEKEIYRRLRVLTPWAWNAGVVTIDIDLRVLDSQPFDVCDTVALLSIPLHGLSIADDDRLRQWEDFCIIGGQLPVRQYARYSPDGCKRPMAWTRQTDVGVVVADPVLREVRSMAPADVITPMPSSPSLAKLNDAPCDTPSERGPASSSEILLPYLWIEDDTYDLNPRQTFHRARSLIFSTVRFYLAIGIYDVPVFALVTVGSCAHLMCGWSFLREGTPISDDHVTIRTSYTNCPVWDLRDSSQAIRLCAFLLQLRHTHLPRLREAFEARRVAFMRHWMADPDASRFQWTLKHQQSSALVRELRARRQRQNEQLYHIKTEKEEAQQEITRAQSKHTKSDINIPAYLGELESRFAHTKDPDPYLVKLRIIACTQLSHSCRCAFHIQRDRRQ